jgi:UDP-N-acetylmuramoylalanine--D-glutamate ligase
MKIEKLKQYKDKKIAILGYWKEGKSSLDFLLKLWLKNITILDKNEQVEKKEGIFYELWEQYLENISTYDLIFKSPWISPYNPLLAVCKDKLITQAQIFFDNYEWKIIWITWTKWKSTTSTLAYETLKKIWYNTKIVWNIWNPVLEEVDILNNENYDFIIYELSSYMLEWLSLNLFIWIVNNIYNCHLDWHEWRPNYEKAKFWVISHSEYKLVNYELKNSTKDIGNVLYFWENWDYYFQNWLFYKKEQVVLKDKKIALQWEHNRKNITAIIWILDIIDTENLEKNIESLKSVLAIFTWLPHRIQNIWIYDWITFIDDAIATTPESTIAAIKTYEHNIWTILLWWEDSWFNFTELKNILEKYNILNIVLFPDTWEKIFWDLNKYDYETIFNLEWKYSPKILKTKSMNSAIDFAYKNTPKWKICILSNAAPSYSLWSWYIEKWLQFQDEVKKYIFSR